MHQEGARAHIQKQSIIKIIIKYFGTFMIHYYEVEANKKVASYLTRHGKAQSL